MAFIYYAHNIILHYHFAYVGIIVEAYSPLGSPGNPMLGTKGPGILDDPVIKEIAQEKGASIAQVP